MSWAQDTKLRLQIFAIMMTFLCPGLLIWQATETRKQIASIWWPSVAGEVRETVVKIAADKKGEPLFYGRVSYRYSVEGKEYTSELTDLGTGAKRSDPAAAQADVSQYKPGMEVLVYYDPRNPGEGVLAKGMPTRHLVVLIVLTVGTIVGSIVSLFSMRGWIKSARQNAAEAAARADQVAKNPIPEGPTDWQEAIRQFGTPEDVFKPGMENMIAGMIIGGLLVVGGGAGVIAVTTAAVSRGAALPWFHNKDLSWVTILGLSALGLLVFGSGIWLIRYVRTLFSLRILVCSNGLVESERGEIRTCRWEDVAEVEETVLQEHFPLHYGLKYAVPAGKSRRYVVRRRDGREFIFDGNRVKGLGRLGKLLRQEAETRGLLWKVNEDSD